MQLVKVLKYAGIAFAIVLLLVAGVLGAGYAWINSESGRAWLESKLDTAVDQPGIDLEVSELSGHIPFDFAIGRLTAADADGIWLAVEDVRLAWRPLDLFSSLIHVTEATVGRVDLARTPQIPPGDAPAPQAEESGAPFRLPMPVELDYLRIAELRIGEPVIGVEALFEIDGRASARSEVAISSHIEIDRLDLEGEHVTADALYRLDLNELTLTVEANEPRDGLVGKLLGLPDIPAAILTLNGTGPLDNWGGGLRLTAGDAVTELGFTLRSGERAAPGAYAIEVAGRVDPGKMAPEAFRPLTDDGIEIDGSAIWTTAETAFLENLVIESPALRIEAGGRFSPGDGELAASASVHLRQPDKIAHLIQPLETSPTNLTASVSGSLGQPRIELTAGAQTVALPGVTIRDLGLTAKAESDQGFAGLADAGAFALSLNAGDLAWAQPGSERLVRGPARIEADGKVENAGQLISLANVAVRLPDASIAGTASANLTEGRFQADLETSLTDLSTLQPLTNLALRGNATLDTTIVLPAFDGRVNVDFSGPIDGFAIGIPAADALLAGDIRLGGKLRLAADGALAVNELSVDTPHANVYGNVSIPAGFETLQANADMTVTEAAVLGSELGLGMGGEMTANVAVSGPLADPSLNAEATLARLELGGEAFQQVNASADLTGLASGIRGRVSATAQSAYGPVETSTSLALTDTAIELSDLSLSAAEASLAGDLSVPMAGPPISGSLALSADTLSGLLSALDMPGNGSAAATVRLSARNGGQSADVVAEISEFEFRTPGQKPTLELGGAKIDARLDNLLATPAIDASVSGERLIAGGASISSLNATAKGDLEGLQIDATVSGEANGPLNLTLAALVQQTAKETTVTFNRLDGEAIGRPIRLRETANLVLSDGTLTLSTMRLSFAEADIRAEGTIGETSTDLSAEVLGLPLALAGLADPALDFGGTMDIEMSLQSRKGAPTGSARLIIDEARLPNRSRVEPLNGTFTARLDAGRLRLEGEASGPVEEPLRVTLDLPANIDPGAGVFEFPSTQRVSGSLRWKGAAGPLVAMAPQDQHVVSGGLEVSLDLSGSLADPQVNGFVAMKDGRYEHLTAGTVLKPLNLRMEADGRLIEIVELSARDGSGGRVSGSGRLLFRPEAAFPMSFALQLDDATLVRRDDVTATVSGSVGLGGSLQELNVKGRIETDRVEARLVDDLPPNVVTLDVVEEGSEEADVPLAKKGEAEVSIVNLDIRVDMQNQVFVRGRGLDSEWRGNMLVTGTAAEPIINGQLNSVRGQISLLGKTFKLQPSQINFLGGGDINPELDIKATTDTPDLLVTVNLVGTAQDPKLELSSSPPVPEDEILARTLFGKTTQQLSAFEAVQLASALGQLTGGGGSAGILDITRSLVGVDVLQVGAGEEGEGATVKAGKYVADDVFVGIEQGTTPQSSEVEVEVELTPNISVESGVGGRKGGNVGVEFKWDY